MASVKQRIETLKNWLIFMNADKKRKEVLIEKLNKMSDPVDSNQGKATLKAIKKIDPNFDAETYM